MADIISYATSPNPKVVQFLKGNTMVVVDTGAVNNASTMNSGVEIPLGGYVVYTIGLNNTPKAWIAYTGGDLLPIARTLGGNPTTVDEAKYYICSVTDAWILDNPMKQMATPSTYLYLDSNNLSSYPGTNNSYMDISGYNHNAELFNGVSYNSGGWLDFDGADDWGNIPTGAEITPGNTNRLTVGGLWKRNGDGGSYETVLHHGNGTSIGASQYWFGWTVDNIVCCTIGAGAGVGWAAGKTNIPADVGKWFYTIASWDGSQVKVWVNGVLKVTYNLGSLNAAETVTRICASGDAGGYLANAGVSYLHVNPYIAFDESEMMKNYHQGPIVTEGLVLSMDAGNLVSYESGSASVNSLVGVAEGSLINGVGYDKAYGGSWVFDGTDDFIDLGNQSLIEGDFCIDIWYQLTEAKSEHYIFTTGYGDAGSILIFTGGIWLNSSATNGRMIGGPGGTINEITNITVERTDGVAKWYKNGVYQSSLSYSGAISLNTNYSIGWAVPRNKASAYTAGNFYSLKMYERGFDASEVSQNYNALRNRFVTTVNNPIETDGEWLKVFRQDSSTGEFFSNANNWAEARTTNSDNPQANKYSILNTVENYKLNDRYTFKINYPNEGVTNIWSQTNNPVNDDGTQGVSGYIGIDIQTTDNGWNGLEQYAAQTSTFLDGTLDPRSNWYYAIGSRPWSGATTFPGWDPPVEVVELWVKYK
tara:strand:+ start:3429 stop:5534 length:2106 start_codon:yes stop_codon:yes gene_type:complete